MSTEFNNTMQRKAFTLIEMMIVIAAIGVLVGMVTIAVGKVKANMDMNEAEAQAEILETAKRSYAFEVRDAATNYASASTDQDRYALIRGSGTDLRIPNSPSTLAAFNDDFTFVMGTTLDEDVTVTKD